MNQGKITLVSYTNTDVKKEFEYEVEHNNGTTSVMQTMLLSTSDKSLSDEGWKASIEIDDMMLLNTPEEAALKLADWLERLAASIRIGNYPEINQQEFTDIKS